MVGETFKVLEAGIPTVLEAPMNIGVDETIEDPLEFEASTTPVVEAALNVELDEAIVVPFRLPNGRLL